MAELHDQFGQISGDAVHATARGVAQGEYLSAGAPRHDSLVATGQLFGIDDIPAVTIAVDEGVGRLQSFEFLLTDRHSISSTS